MRKELLNELNQMKYLFGYKPGKVISEQHNKKEMDSELDEMDFEDLYGGPEVAPAPEKEKEKTREKETEEKPKRRGLPSRNPDDLPNVDPHPQGSEEGDIEMDFDFEEPEMDVDFEDEPMIRRNRRFSRD